MAREQAVQEFAALALQRTRARTGVLIFVSLFERRVVVLGDDAIHARVGDAEWLAVDGLVIERVRDGALADGLVAGVERVGAVLAEHFPVSGDAQNELPDHLIVRSS
jgi:putative membrane protein